MHTLHICLLGDFRLLYGNDPLTTVNTPRLQTLFAYLLLHRQAPQARQYLAFQFWPDSSEKQAHTNLRKLLFQLRNALPNSARFLTQDHLTVHWRPDAPYTLDVAELQASLARCFTSDGKPIAHAMADDLSKAVNLYRGELLPGCYEEWLLPIRQQLHRDVLYAIEQLINLAEHQREYRAGIRYAQRLLGFDPLHEAGYRRLMQLHALNGDRAAALQNYHTYVALLQQELGVEPEEETQALYQHLSRLEQPALVSMPQVDTPLVGRTTEWQTLLATWRQVQRGQAHFVGLIGEAGMGKTRLTEEWIAWANAQGIRSARSRSYEAEGGLAYAPVTEWLRSSGLRPALKKLDKVWLSEVARLLPELLTEQPSLTVLGPLVEAWQRQRFFEALARAVLAEKSPLLLVIDDLQWCDSETLTWLRYLLRYEPKARLLILGAWRSEGVTEASPLQTFLRDLGNTNQLIAIELRPLNVQESADLAQQLATRLLTSAETEQLYAATEGHPLFVVETMQSLRDQPFEVQATPTSSLIFTTIPPRVQNVIHARLTHLSATAREVVGVAATIGRRFRITILERASQSQDEALVSALDELLQRRIVREVGREEYDFCHDRIREVAYQGLSQARRRLSHRRVAEALELTYPDSLDEISGELAQHYLQSNNHEKAGGYLQRAGERAAAQYAIQTAVDYFGRALALLSPNNHIARFPLLLALAKIANHQGRRAEGKQDLAALDAILLALDDGTAATARRRAEVALLRADYGRGISDNVMIKAAAQEAVVLAAQCHADDLAAQANLMWGYADFWEYDFFAQARPRFALALTQAQAAGLHGIEAEVCIQLAVYGLYTGEPTAQIAAMAQRAMALYQQLGNPAGEAGALSILAYIIYTQREGDYDLGIRYCEQALQIHRDGWDTERFVLGNLAFLWYYQGDYQQAKPLLERQLVITQEAQNWGAEAGAWMELGCLYLAQGDYANAQRHLLQCWRLSQENNARQQYRVKIEGLLALFYHLTDDNPRASVHGEAAINFARNLADPRVQGDAFTRYARVLSHQDKLAEAERLFQQALTCFRRMEQANHATMPLAGLAAIALRQGELVQAQAYVHEILAHLATHQLDRTDEELYVYMTGYRVLQELADQRAESLLQLAHEQLQIRAASLASEEERRLFWSAPTHAEVLLALKQERTVV